MEINLEKLAFDLDFHPLENLVSAALINGDLLLYQFSSDSTPQKVSEVHAYTESCRAIRFIDDGRAIVMGSLDRLILATYVETGGTIAHLEDAHGEAINKIINLHQSKIASGDDGGCIKVWDTRQHSCCGTCQAYEDYVSDMTFVHDAMKLLGTSRDETLSVCNLQKETKVQARSEFSEEELFSVVLVKTYCVLACFSVAGLITCLFVGCPKLSLDELLRQKGIQSFKKDKFEFEDEVNFFPNYLSFIDSEIYSARGKLPSLSFEHDFGELWNNQEWTNSPRQVLSSPPTSFYVNPHMISRDKLTTARFMVATGKFARTEMFGCTTKKLNKHLKVNLSNNLRLYSKLNQYLL
ncbi:hypothetical protein UlMin_012076 [Ulmus minor]